MGDKMDNRNKFIELFNKNFTDKDVFVNISYIEKCTDYTGILKDILHFFKMPLSDKYESTFRLDAQIRLVKMIYFKEVG